MSRTKNTFRNIVFGFIYKTVILFVPFIIRTIVIKKIGAEFLGLNSLFTSILQVLSISELGFSSAITYFLYKPIANKDNEAICALLNFYKKIYRIIGLIILIVGLGLLPFIHVFIKEELTIDLNIYIFYLLYLINTCLTYFLFAHKKSLITANQRRDIVTIAQTICALIQYTIQVLSILVFKNLYLFVIAKIVSTVIDNIILLIISNKMYTLYICKGELDKKIKKGINKRVVGLAIQKVCERSRNSFDSIFISIFLGFNLVAIYSNYYSIMYSITMFINIFTTSLLASVGNSIAVETEQKNYNDMNKINFIYMWISGWCTVCLLCLFQPFMKIWMGEELLFPFGVVILLCAYFYALKMNDVRTIYGDAKGLWFEERYRAIIEALSNLVLNIILGSLFGIYGIILGTLIPLFLVNFVYGSTIIFKHYFVNQKISLYYLRHLLYLGVTFIVCIITYLGCSMIKLDGIIGLLIKMIICLILPNILYLIIYFRTNTFKESLGIIKRIFQRKKV